jgi:hypothetical protein
MLKKYLTGPTLLEISDYPTLIVKLDGFRQEIGAISKDPVLFLCRNSSLAWRQGYQVGYLAEM